MSPVAVSLQQILDLASHYSPRPTPDMRKRSEIGNDLAAELGSVLPGLAVSLGLTDLGLRTEPGAPAGFLFSPIPWVRVYSPDYAPSAQAGIEVPNDPDGRPWRTDPRRWSTGYPRDHAAARTRSP
jgi:hypothetical protein